MAPPGSPETPGPAWHGLGTRTAVLGFLIVLTGLVGVGRLAMEAWLNRPAPTDLPRVRPEVVPERPVDQRPAILLVIIDGLREASAWAPSNPPMPWLQAQREHGAWGVGIAGEPTLTAPCVRALLTGRRPDLLTGFRNFNARPVDGSIVGYCHDAGATTVHAGDAAAFQFCKPHYRPDDVLQFPDQGPTDQGVSDRKSIAFLLERLVLRRPDVVTLHLTGPDHAGHKYGAVGYEYWRACRTVDEQIAEVTNVYRAQKPHGLVLIAADHGVSPMGTHGGGESSAKRAPFVLLGPNVEPVGPVEIDQCALAPTVCALLGLPQPPLADAPPAPALTALPEEVEVAALDAYIQARLEVATRLGGDVDFVERRRAALTVERTGDDATRELLDAAALVNAEINPSAAGDATLALLLAALWLMGVVHFASAGRARRVPSNAVLALAGAGLLLTFDPIAGLAPIGPVAAAFLGALSSALGIHVTGSWRLRGAVVTLACLCAMPVLTEGGLTLQGAFELSDEMSTASSRLLVLGLVGVVLALVFVRPRRLARHLLDELGPAPGLIAGFGGAVLGFLLTMRPFIDPFVHLMIIYAVLGLVVVLVLLRSPGARAAPRHVRWTLLGTAVLLFLGTRIAEGVIGEVWVNVTPKTSGHWLAAGLCASALVFTRVRWSETVRADRSGLAVAGLAFALACVLRLVPEASLVGTLGTSGYLVLSLGTTILAFGALVHTLLVGSAEGRMAVRVLAALALARRLSVMDAEFAVFAVVAFGAVHMARLPVPRTRRQLAWLAVGILALRTAIFHAMGFTESFSTLDVGQAFTGLGTGEAQSVDAAGGTVITWQIVVAGIQLAVRMALPWLLILAALGRAFAASPDAPPGAVRVLLLDLAVTFAARGGAIVTALWAWWRQSWWIKDAYTVYAYGAADVLLLLVCACVAGGWKRREIDVRPPATARVFA